MAEKSSITKESVIKRILARQNQGKDLSNSAIRKEDPSLEAAAQRLFGGWYATLDVARIDSTRYRRQKPFGYWTRERIIEEIIGLNEVGEDLHSTSMKVKHPDLLSVTIKKFHSWHLACEAAGIAEEKYSSKKRTGYYTNEGIFKEILHLKEKGQDLSASKMVKANSKLFAAATNRFKSWYRALEAAGIDPGEYRKLSAKGYWTKDEVRKVVMEYHQSGASLQYSQMRKENPALLAAMEKRFGSWSKALNASGIDSSIYRKQNPSRYWNKDRVIDEIRKLNEKGEDLNISALRKKYSALVKYAIDYFESWDKALEAAGVDPWKYRKLLPRGYWTRERILTTLKSIHSSGQDIRPSALTKKHLELIAAARKQFEKIEDMYLQAGINPVQIGMQRKWTKEEILSTLTRLQHDGIDIRPSSLIDNGYVGLIQAGRRLFGSLDATYEAAGLDLASTGHKKRRYYRYTKDKAIQYLIELKEKGEDISPKSLERHHSGLYQAGIELFGSTWNLYEAAGLSPIEYVVLRRSGYWTKEKIVEEIIRLDKIGEDVHLRAIKKNHHALERAAYRLFGSWHTTCEAASIPPEKYLTHVSPGYNTRERLIQQILQLKQRGIDLNGSAIARMNSSLFAAGISRFGTWYNALEASGINPDDYRRQVPKGHWTKERIIQDIGEMVTRDEEISYTSASRMYSALVSAADKKFGSWAIAIKEAGYDYDSIRKDRFRESFKGKIFEKYAKMVFESIGWKLKYNKLQRFEEGDCKPDFVDLSNGTWVDAKLNSFGGGVEGTIEKYFSHCNKIIIVFLMGKKRFWPDVKVDFIPISDFYGELREKKVGEDLIADLEKLRKGILRPELQSELDGFIKKQLKAA